MKTIVIGGFSGIANAIIKKLNKKNNEIIYTYNRTFSENLKKFKGFKLDIASIKSIDNFSKNKHLKNWDNLIIMPATQKPIGLFTELKAKLWIDSININFSNQMYLLNKLYKKRKISNKNKTIILWAGGGTNNATKYYSAYTISKIAQIKMAELLNYEMADVKVVILGPGWVKTRIHLETLNNKKFARENFFRTLEKFRNNSFVNINQVAECVDAIIKSKKIETGGRNISVEFDKWMDKDFYRILSTDDNMYKLRRDLNNFNIEDLGFNLEALISFISKNKDMQVFSGSFYNFYQKMINLKIKNEFLKKKTFNLFGLNCKFPINSSVKPFSLSLYDMLIINHYILKKKKTKNILELGVQNGIYSILLLKNGFKIKSVESSLNNINKVKKFLQLNKINHKIEKMNNDELFKNINEYESIKIDSKFFGEFFLDNITKFNLNNKSVLIKIFTYESAKKLWSIIKNHNYLIKSQKVGWKRVKKISDIPSSSNEGFIII